MFYDTEDNISVIKGDISGFPSGSGGQVGGSAQRGALLTDKLHPG